MIKKCQKSKLPPDRPGGNVPSTGRSGGGESEVALAGRPVEQELDQPLEGAVARVDHVCLDDEVAATVFALDTLGGHAESNQSIGVTGRAACADERHGRPVSSRIPDAGSVGAVGEIDAVDNGSGGDDVGHCVNLF